MIELTSVTGGRVAFNPMLVFAIEATGRGTQIVSPSGGVVVVSEDFDEVQRRVAAWTKSA